MPGKTDLYSFGDPGEFDKHNPIYLYEQKWAPEMLFEIANADGHELTKYDIASKLDTSPMDLMRKRLLMACGIRYWEILMSTWFEMDYLQPPNQLLEKDDIFRQFMLEIVD